jgi:signal peptidase I
MKFFTSRILKILLLLFIAIIFLRIFLFDAVKISSSSMANTLLAGDYVFINKLAYSLSTPSTIPMTDFKIPNIELIKFSDIKRMDVVLFDFPGNPSELNPSEHRSYVKRILGLPGDTLQIINRVVFVNGKKISDPEKVKFREMSSLPEHYFDKNIFQPDSGWNADNFGPVIVPSMDNSIGINHRNVYYWGMLINREFGDKVVSIEGSVIMIDGKPSRSYTFKNDYYFVLGDSRDESVDSRFWGFVPRKSIYGRAEFVYWSSSESFSFSNPFGYFSKIRLDRILNGVK